MGCTDKSKRTDPIMTNSAALRVLYDLAGGRMKTWGALGRELGAMLGEDLAAGKPSVVASGLPPVNVDDIYKRNRPWPSGFGPKEYCRAFRRYADEGHASHYGALLKVQQSLEASNAYTPQVKALVENIRPDADDREVAESLERVMEAIIETARPYNKVGKLVEPMPRGCEQGEEAGHEAGLTEHQAACGLAAARGVDCAPCMGGAVADVVEPAPAVVGCAPDMMKRTTGVVVPATRAVGCEVGAAFNAASAAPACSSVTGAGRDSQTPMAVPSGGGIGLPRIAQMLGSCAPDKTGVEILTGIVPVRLRGLLAPEADLAHACEQGLSSRDQAALVQELCCDSGLACRAMRHSCEALLTGGAIDADKVFSCANSLLAVQPGCSAGVEVSRALSLYTRYADGDAARALLCLVLMGLVGISGFNRIMMCPDVGLLFVR